MEQAVACERQRLRCELERTPRVPGATEGTGGCEHPPCSVCRSGRKARRTLERAPMGGEPSACCGPTCGFLERRGDSLVDSVGSRGHVPGASIAIRLGDEHLRKSPMCSLPLDSRCFRVDQRADDRVPEDDVSRCDLNEPGSFCGSERLANAQERRCFAGRCGRRLPPRRAADRSVPAGAAPRPAVRTSAAAARRQSQSRSARVPARPGARAGRAGCRPPRRADAPRRRRRPARSASPAAPARPRCRAARGPPAGTARMARPGRDATRPGTRAARRSAAALRTRGRRRTPGRASAHRREGPASAPRRRAPRAATAPLRRPPGRRARPARAQAPRRARAPAGRAGANAGRARAGTARAGSRREAPAPTRRRSLPGAACHRPDGSPLRAAPSCPGRRRRPGPALALRPRRASSRQCRDTPQLSLAPDEHTLTVPQRNN